MHRVCLSVCNVRSGTCSNSCIHNSFYANTVGVNIKFPYRTVAYRPYRTFKKCLARPCRFILLGMIQYYCYTQSEYRAESSSMWIFLVCLLLFFPPVSYSAVPLQSIDCFCSSRRLFASLLARFALVRRRNCSCSCSRQFRFSPSIVYALLLARSASVRRLFLLF